MARSIGVGEYPEPDDSVMDASNHKPAFRGLRQYVKELDSNTLPPFLARLCARDKPTSYSEEEILCIFETAAEVHGRNIVPHIGQIVSAIIRIMSSGSLHSAGCSKVVCTLSRYAIDPLGREEEKSEIISSLCQPLSDCLMNTNKSISSGSALCITALVQSNNWQFASNELVDGVCLKVSGALQEVCCHTVVHLSLVVALTKYNPLILEPYGRSLIRSGVQILDHSSKTSNSQMIMSSIQMIHCIMKRLDARIISSEISSIIHALDQCQGGFIPDVCTAASQAVETAKLLERQEECGDRKKTSPLINCSGRHIRNGSNSPIDDADIRDSGSSESPCEVQSVHSLNEFDSQLPVGHCVDILGSTRVRRRLWSSGSHFSHGMSNDEFFNNLPLDCHDTMGIIGQSSSGGLVKASRRCSDVLTRVGDPCPTCLTPRATNQVYRRQALSTPRKQVYTFTSCSDSERETHRLPKSLAFRQIQCPDHLLFQKDGQIEERTGYCNPSPDPARCGKPTALGTGYCKSIQQSNQRHAQSTDLLTRDLEFPTTSRRSDSARTSCEEHHADAAENTARTSCEERHADAAENQKMSGAKKREANCLSSQLVSFVCVVLIVMLLLALWKQHPSNELYLVPT